MKIQRKHLIIGGLVGATMFTSAFLYYQYTKLMEYCISLNKVILNKFSLTATDIDLYLNFKNNSKLKIDIVSQNYKAFVNDKEVVSASNSKTISILPQSTSIIPVKIGFNPSNLLTTFSNIAQDIFANPEKIKIKIKVDLKIKLWILPISIPYEFESNLKDLMAKKQTNTSTNNKKKC